MPNTTEGNKIVCHTAEYLSVQVYRDGNIYTQTFVSTDEGATPETEVEVQYGKAGSTGTIIQYKPDPRVYGDYFIDIESLRQMLKEMAMFSTGLNIQLIIDDKMEEFHSENGLVDGLDTTNALSKPFSYYYESPDCKVELALQWVTKGGKIKGYANNLYMPDGGEFIKGFKSSLTRTFNSLADRKYSGDAIRGVLDGFVSVKVKMGQFTNQQKSALANPEARTATSAAITEALKEFVSCRKDDFDKVVALLDKIQKAEKAADRARKQILETSKEIERNASKKVFSTDKLKDSELLGEESTLLITEGKERICPYPFFRLINGVA
jgi:topoisomerase-4 subunit B